MQHCLKFCNTVTYVSFFRNKTTPVQTPQIPPSNVPTTTLKDPYIPPFKGHCSRPVATSSETDMTHQKLPNIVAVTSSQLTPIETAVNISEVNLSTDISNVSEEQAAKQVPSRSHSLLDFVRSNEKEVIEFLSKQYVDLKSVPRKRGQVNFLQHESRHPEAFAALLNELDIPVLPKAILDVSNEMFFRFAYLMMKSSTDAKYQFQTCASYFINAYINKCGVIKDFWKET